MARAPAHRPVTTKLQDPFSWITTALPTLVPSSGEWYEIERMGDPPIGAYANESGGHSHKSCCLRAPLMTVRSKVSVKSPFFLITIDTEEDNAWSRALQSTTRNAEFLERFQRLCEQYGHRPTWLTTHEMIRSPVFRRFAREVIANGTAEIGMHLHAWNSPPFRPLTTDDARTQPFLIEYQPRVMREKIHALTAALEDALGVKMVSHRAGRWAFDERYAEMLLEEGYKVDCSVTPLVNWATTLGDPAGHGGTDYVKFPREPYWIDLDDISRAGASDLLEVPVTIVSFRSSPIARLVHTADRLPRRLAGLRAITNRLANRLSPPTAWLRPTAQNGQLLLRVIDDVYKKQRYAEFMLHSSELMPGGSPTFPDAQTVETLYADMELLFQRVDGRFRSGTLCEFHDHVASSMRSGS